MALPRCRYCSNPVKRKGAVICFDPECDRKRRVSNAKSYFQRCQAAGIKKNRGPRQVEPKPKPKTKEVSCLKCDETFLSELDKRGIPIKHICEGCRRYQVEELRMVEVWG